MSATVSIVAGAVIQTAVGQCDVVTGRIITKVLCTRVAVGAITIDLATAWRRYIGTGVVNTRICGAVVIVGALVVVFAARENRLRGAQVVDATVGGTCIAVVTVPVRDTATGGWCILTGRA